MTNSFFYCPIPSYSWKSRYIDTVDETMSGIMLKELGDTPEKVSTPAQNGENEKNLYQVTYREEEKHHHGSNGQILQEPSRFMKREMS